MKKKFEKSLRGRLQKPPFKKRYILSLRYKLSALATTPFCNFFTFGQIYSKKSPQMLNPLQGGLVYGNVTKVCFWNLKIFYINGGGGGGNYTF